MKIMKHENDYLENTTPLLLYAFRGLACTYNVFQTINSSIIIDIHRKDDAVYNCYKNKY